jgi:Predicted periplasmic lipoprotein (DUF2279)
MNKTILLFSILFLGLATNQKAQSNFFAPSPSFNPSRFYPLIGGGAAAYTGTVILLNKVWYSQYPKSRFHIFDDTGEWKQMDKGGHVVASYGETYVAYNALRWSGVKEGDAIWGAAITGMVFQTSLEIMDGYSDGWGFSWSDMAANTFGCLFFASQQAAWGEQRAVLKVSNTPVRYSAEPIFSEDGKSTTTLKERAEELYGVGYAQTALKDYNALHYWVSINPDAFLPAGQPRLPHWLNVSFGYGASNLYGGTQNKWVAKNGAVYNLNENKVPRMRVALLSLDVDLSRIETNDPFLQTVFKTVNFIKIPSPTLELNGQGKLKFKWVFF